MPLIPQQELILIDRLRVEGYNRHFVVDEFALNLVKEELENYPPVRIVQFQVTEGAIWVLVETV